MYDAFQNHNQIVKNKTITLLININKNTSTTVQGYVGRNALVRFRSYVSTYEVVYTMICLKTVFFYITLFILTLLQKYTKVKNWIAIAVIQ